MKRNFKIFALLFLVATLFIGCNLAPEGHAWDYDTIKQNDGAYQNPYRIASGKKYKGYGYLSTYSGGSGAGWKFVNDTDKTVKCKFNEKFYHSDHSSYIYVNLNKVSNPKDGFEVPPGATVSLSARCAYYIKSGGSGSKEKFYEFYLYCK